MKARTTVAPARAFCYLCPEQHETYVANDQGTTRPQLTALICRKPAANGQPCKQFALYVDRPA